MLTSYSVKCPNEGCGWRGSLLPKGNAEAWRGFTPRLSEVVFQCPECETEWHARVVGDDVVPLPQEQLTGSAR
jgi:hypothetical protein